MQKFIDFVLKETGFRMENPDKISRAVNGTATSRGLVDGVGEDAPAMVILAKYDELGGYITKNGYKVKNRCFFNPKTKQPIEKPEIKLIIRINGEFIEYDEKKEETLEIKLAKKQFEENTQKKEQEKDEKEEVKRGRPKKE